MFHVRYEYQSSSINVKMLILIRLSLRGTLKAMGYIEVHGVHLTQKGTFKATGTFKPNVYILRTSFLYAGLL